MADAIEVRVVEHDGGPVCVVSLGEAENLVDPGFLERVNAALDKVEHDHAGAGLVTTATGKSYCNGFDTGYLFSLDGDALGAFIDGTCALLARVLTFPAATVAAVNGHAFGIGAMLAIAHDQRVMRDDRGWWCLPEVDLEMRFHPFMQELVTSRLTARTANEAMLAGRRYSGVDAQTAGIADEACAADDLAARAVARAAAWGGKSPKTLRGMKRQLHADVLDALQRGFN